LPVYGLLQGIPLPVQDDRLGNRALIECSSAVQVERKRDRRALNLSDAVLEGPSQMCLVAIPSQGNDIKD
jgi:hypothetical protein